MKVFSNIVSIDVEIGVVVKWVLIKVIVLKILNLIK